MTGNINIHGSTGVDLKRIEAIANDAKGIAGSISKAQLGIDKVDNTSDIDKPVSKAQQDALNAKANVSDFNSHAGNTTLHVTANERSQWNGKTNISDFNSHTGNTTLHITASERSKWNGKADASHGTHVAYSSSAPRMDGSASSGSAGTVARSDHVHPTDTSRAPAAHNHSVGDITGALPISKGGTGATNSDFARSNIGAFSSSGGTISGAVNITGAVDIKNNSVHIGSGNSGAKINFGDSDYVHICESTDDNLEIKAKNINFVTSGGLTNNGEKIGGGDFIITSSSPSSLSSGQIAFVYI